MLAFAGSDTTKNALASGLQAFVANPARDRAVPRRRGDPGAARSKRCCAGRRRSRSGRAARRSTWRWTASPSRRAIGWWRCCGRPTATKRSSTTRSRSTSAAPTTRTSRSAAADRTTASGAMLARAEIRAVLDELLLPRRRHQPRPAQGHLSQPDQQHVDLRRDGDLPDAALGGLTALSAWCR